MPRFVVLLHDWPALHWDFLVEAGETLRAWRLPSEPRAECDSPAEPNVPHRLLYLDYEGPVSGGRGTVSRWDAGTCDWHADEPDCVELEVRGAKLRGRVVIRATGGECVFRLTGPAGAG